MGKQSLLIVSDGSKCHKHRLEPEKSITIGNQLDAHITYPELQQPINVVWEEASGTWTVGSTALKLNQTTEIHQEADHPIKLFLCDDLTKMIFDISTKLSLTFGQGLENDIELHNSKADFILIRDESEQGFKAQVFEGEVYDNFELLQRDQILVPGDQLFIDGMTILIGKDDIEIVAPNDSYTSYLAPLTKADKAYSEDYPDYHRSPRIIYRAPEDKVNIAKPSPMPAKPTEELMKVLIPPLIMIVLSIVITIFQPRGIYIIMTLTMTSVTVIFSLTTYLKNVKKYKVDTKERNESYAEYLKNKAVELFGISEKQRNSLIYHYPNVLELQKMAQRVDSRIYEKTMFHHDFLSYRVGTGKEPCSFTIEFRNEEFTQEKDDLLEDANWLKNQFTEVKDVPVATDLINGPVGYIGPRRLVIEQLQMMVMQTAFFHSYYDLQFITIFPEEEKQDWEWMRWLPHANLRDVNVRGFVYHERSRDQVLNTLYQILKERKQTVEENKGEKVYFVPRFVVLITDEKLILDHTVMEFFNEDPSHLGVSLIFVQEVMQSLPEHVKTVVDIRDSKSGNIIIERGELVNREFVPDHFPENYNKESISRALAPLNHLQNLKNSIPESVTFLQMYNVERVEELNIATRWRTNETYKSLAVPLGFRGKDDIVNLNLHEKAHGPHGLVAGTTGSGKSEIIQSYILSLAVNFHPYEVAFLLIDYKGGGMANLFKNLPHLLGSITNLDGAQSMRALASIKAELQKRQRLFGECDVNHINQYQKLYKQGKVSEPMPHLFLISDEFAELKAEQPEFMKELVSTARIGRSLGIHLILATQKPSGVVDDQIWSNSKFKLALKVQNAADSNEIIKTPDAADITLPGRAYLQVGNNEIYELFQSAWSGADYAKDKEDEDDIDTTIYAINELGQYDILTEDLSGLDKKEDLTKKASELDAVIDHIHQFTIENGIAELPRPWLPPLEERIFLPELHPVQYVEEWKKDKRSLEAVVGFMDIPEMQAQEPLVLDITSDGHIAVFSSPSFGKSTFLQTATMDLVRQHSPKHLHVYLLDFGTNGLLPLKNLPHVADTMMVDEEEKMNKFIRRLLKEMKDRKQKLSQYGVANIPMYERASKNEVPHIVLIIDAMDSVNEAPFKEGFEKMIAQIAREGASIGVHMIVSAGRQMAIRTPILANIKNQISLYMIDSSETRNIVGRTSLTIEEIQGRGLVKIEQPVSFQTALPTNGEDTLDIIESIQREASEMDQAWKGERPESIPMVPEVLYMQDFLERKQVKKMLENGDIPFAVDFEEVQPINLSVVKDANTWVLSDAEDKLERTLSAMAKIMEMNESADKVLFDNAIGGFQAYKGSFNLYADTKNSMNEVAEQVVQIFEKREDTFKQIQAEMDGQMNLQEFLSNVRPIFVVITDTAYLIEQLMSEMQTKLAKTIEQGPKMGIYFIAGAVPSTVQRSYDDIATALKKLKTGVVVGRISDQNILEVVNSPYREPMLPPYEAYYIKNGKAEKIKMVAPL